MGLFKTLFSLTTVALLAFPCYAENGAQLPTTLLPALSEPEYLEQALLEPVSLDTVSLEGLRSKTQYFCKTQKTEAAVQSYLDFIAQSKVHDEESLRALSLGVLEDAIRGNDQELQLLAIFCLTKLGEKIAHPYLEQLIQSPYPECQLAAVASPFVSTDQVYEKHLIKLMSSPYLGIRIQALYQLSQKKHPSTVGLAANLQQRIPEQYHMLFPTIYAMMNDGSSRIELRKLLDHSLDYVRAETILQIGNHNLRDFTPQLQRLLSRAPSIEQEAALFSLARWGALPSLDTVEKLCDSRNLPLRCSALFAIQKERENFATEKMAATLLSNEALPLRWARYFPKLSGDLERFLSNPDPTLQLNATLSLLDLKSSAALEKAVFFVTEIFKSHQFWPAQSAGGACTYWKVVHGPQPPLIPAKELARSTFYLAGEILTNIYIIDEEAFLQCARTIMKKEISPLYPTIIDLLAQSIHDRPNDRQASILLEQASRQVGAPSLRILALFALYKQNPSLSRLHEIIAWIEMQQTGQLFKIENIPNPNQLEILRHHNLSLEQTSELVFMAYELLAESQDHTSLTAMVTWLKTANTRNRCILATAILSSLI